MTDDRSRGELREIAEAFCRKTGWTPAITRHVAGALRYAKYDYFKRLIMKLIANNKVATRTLRAIMSTPTGTGLTHFVESFLAAIPLQEGGH